MKIVMLSPFLPYREARAGAPQAIYDRLCLLAPRHEVILVTFVEQGEQRHIGALHKLGIEVRPVLRRGSAKGMALVRKRLRLSMALIFGRLPMLVTEFESPVMARRLRRTLKEAQPDLLLVEHRLAGSYLPGAGARSERATLFSEHDALGGPSGFSATSFIALLIDKMDAHRWRRFTRAAWEGADAVLVPTEEDAAVVRSSATGVAVEVVPYGIMRPDLCERSEQTRRGDTILFVGNFDHAPNREAAMKLASVILPAVQRSIPSARLVLVGKNPTSEIEVLASEIGGVEVAGEVESVEPYLRDCTVLAAPLESGGGARMKLMEAMMAGAPIVTTSLGARGLGADAGRHLLVADSDSDFSQAVVDVLRDPELRGRLGDAARELACGPDRTAERAYVMNAVLERYAR